MAIQNNICEKCDHKLVCSKQTTLEKFVDESKKFIDMDIEIKLCKDYKDVE